MLASALRRNIGHRALEDLQQGLLHAFAGDVACDRRVVSLAADLVDLIDVDDAALRLLFIVSGSLIELEDDVFDIFTDVARFGERRSVDDGERNREHAGQSLRQQSLAGARRADQHDVGLLQLDVLARIALVIIDALVVVVDRDSELLLRPFLADHVKVEELFDLFRFGERAGPLQRSRLILPILGDDVQADIDALVADVDRRSGDQLLDVALRFVAEAAPQYVAAVPLLRHVCLDPFWGL